MVSKPLNMVIKEVHVLYIVQNEASTSQEAPGISPKFPTDVNVVSESSEDEMAVISPQCSYSQLRTESNLDQS